MVIYGLNKIKSFINVPDQDRIPINPLDPRQIQYPKETGNYPQKNSP